MSKKQYVAPDVELLTMAEEIIRTSGEEPYIEDRWDELLPLGDF